MPKITYRLPGREQYSYAEVEFDDNDVRTMSPEELRSFLDGALSDLDNTYPQSDARPVQQAPQAAPQAAPAAGGRNCAHGARTHSTGVSARGPWQAYFCPLKDKAQQCTPEWIKQGQPGWVY